MSKFDTFFKNEEKKANAKSKPLSEQEIQDIKDMEMETLIAEGKERYSNADTREKIEILIKQKRNPLDTNCQSLETFNKAVTEHRDITTYAIGTTGLRNDDQMMQISLRTYKYDEDKQAYVESSKVAHLVKADEAIINRAIEGRDSYDIFIEGGFGRPINEGGVGITEEEYKAGKMVHTPTETAEVVNTYISKNRDSLFIGINPASMNKYALAIGVNMPVCIDVQSIFKEYDYKQYRDDTEQYLNTSGDKYTFVNMCTDTIGVDELYSTPQKTSCIMGVLNVIAEKEHLIEKTTPMKISSELSKDYVEVSQKITAKLNENNPHSLEEMVNMQAESSNSSGHGNLYSDKENDKVDIVTGNVQKVGEASIPHISEAPINKTTDELLRELISRQERTEAVLNKLVHSVTTVIELAAGNRLPNEIPMDDIHNEKENDDYDLVQ